MPRKKKFDYFQCFVDISDCGVRYVREVDAYFRDQCKLCEEGGSVDGDGLLQKFQELHKIEEESDEIVHEVYTNLATEFVTPIDREDILLLVGELDSVVDDVDDVLQRMFMYNITTIPDSFVQMMDVVKRAVEALNMACQKFTYFKKSESIRERIVKINDIEDEGDRVYITSMHDAYVRAKESHDYDEALTAFGVSGVLNALEKCCDACEHVSDTMGLVIMKNA